MSGDVQNTREGPRSIRNERVNETDAPSRDKGPGGHRDERDEQGAIEDDLERLSDGYGGDVDGIRRGEDGTMSGARRNSKRVATTPLPEDEAGQHGRRKRRTMDIPRLSTPSTINPRRPTGSTKPPRRRGQLKTSPRNISTSLRRQTHQVIRARRGRIR